MTTALFSPYCYKEHQTSDYLSKTFESNVLHTPADTRRRTVSQENYLRHRYNEPEQFKTPWGRKYSYGGMGVVQLPNEIRLKGEPPLVMQKGTHHYGSGICLSPRGIPVQQFYSLTPTKKSYTRSTDELIQSPNKIDLSKQQIESKFPAEHPYTSHISSANIFPSFGSVTENKSQKNAEREENSYNPILKNASPLSAEEPAAPYDVELISKARGSFGRHEVLRIPLNTQRKPMTWPGGPSYYQIVKGGNREKQVYYPTPTRLINESTVGLSDETVKVLKDLHLSRWETTYQKAYNKTPVKYINLDSEETLKLITSGPNARVPKSLMTDAFNPTENARTVEEISEETDWQKRIVHFENINTDKEHNTAEDENEEEEEEEAEENEEEKQKKKEEAKIEKSMRTFPRPAIKLTRPFTTLDTSRTPNNEKENTNRPVKSAFVRSTDSSDLNTVKQSWSKSDFTRKFNSRYYNDDYTDLYERRFGYNPRRSFVPEAGNAPSYVFH